MKPLLTFRRSDDCAQLQPDVIYRFISLHIVQFDQWSKSTHVHHAMFMYIVFHYIALHFIAFYFIILNCIWSKVMRFQGTLYKIKMSFYRLFESTLEVWTRGIEENPLNHDCKLFCSAKYYPKWKWGKAIFLIHFFSILMPRQCMNDSTT